MMKRIIFFIPILFLACGQENSDSADEISEDQGEQTVIDSSEKENSEELQTEMTEVVDPLIGSWFTAVKVKGKWYEVGGTDNLLHIVKKDDEDYTIRKNDRCGKSVQLNHNIMDARIADDGDFILECEYPDSEKTIKMIGSYQESDENWPARIFSLEYNVFTEIITEGVMKDYKIEAVKLYQGAQQGKEPKQYDNYNCETGEDPDEIKNQ